MEKTPSILIVDDEPLARESFKLMVRHDGYAADTASSGTEALACLDRHPYALVITDNRMPEMSGEELAEAIKRKHPDMRIVMISGYPPARPVSAIDVVLRKPQDIQILRETVRNLLSGRQPGAPGASSP